MRELQFTIKHCLPSLLHDATHHVRTEHGPAARSSEFYREESDNRTEEDWSSSFGDALKFVWIQAGNFYSFSVVLRHNSICESTNDRTRCSSLFYSRTTWAVSATFEPSWGPDFNKQLETSLQALWHSVGVIVWVTQLLGLHDGTKVLVFKLNTFAKYVIWRKYRQ